MYPLILNILLEAGLPHTLVFGASRSIFGQIIPIIWLIPIEWEFNGEFFPKNTTWDPKNQNLEETPPLKTFDFLLIWLNIYEEKKCFRLDTVSYLTLWTFHINLLC